MSGLQIVGIGIGIGLLWGFVAGALFGMRQGVWYMAGLQIKVEAEPSLEAEIARIVSQRREHEKRKRQADMTPVQREMDNDAEWQAALKGQVTNGSA